MTILSRFSLKGKTAVITGPGQGIGKAVAYDFAEAGADLVLTGVDVLSPEKSESELQEISQALKSMGARTSFKVADLRKQGEVEAVLDVAMRTFGKVDILVNNVGGTTLTPFLEMSLSTWQAGIEENLATTFLGCRVFGAQMASQRAGAIVNIASMDGRSAARHRAHYGAGKAGVISLTQTLGAELAQYNVRVNGIAPTWVKTERLGELFTHFPDRERMALATIPLGRFASPREVADLAVFLASDASSYITGQTINITGGALITGTPEMMPL